MPRKKSWNLYDVSHTEVAEMLKKTDTILIPMGSLEKHGAHDPLSTDLITTLHVVEQAASKAQVPYLPPMPFGYSPHHMGRVNEGTGTITFSGDTYRKIVYEITRSLIYHGFNKMIFVSHHASNVKVIDDIFRRLYYTTGCFVCWYKTPTERTYSVLGDIIEGPPEETPGWHAGELETSTVMAYDMDKIDVDQMEKGSTHAPAFMGPNFRKKDGDPNVEFRGVETIMVPMEHHDYCDNAVIGNPFRATPEKGRKYFDLVSDHLAAFIKEVEKFKIEIKNRDYNERA
jgi:creatinine amidohydrolase